MRINPMMPIASARFGLIYNVREVTRHEVDHGADGGTALKTYGPGDDAARTSLIDYASGYGGGRYASADFIDALCQRDTEFAQGNHARFVASDTKPGRIVLATGPDCDRKPSALFDAPVASDVSVHVGWDDSAFLFPANITFRS